MSFELNQWLFFVIIKIPHNNLSFIVARCKELPIFCEVYSFYPSVRHSQYLFGVTGLDIPNFNGLVSGTGNNLSSVGIEDHFGDVVFVSEESLETGIVVVEVPQFD